MTAATTHLAVALRGEASSFAAVSAAYCEMIERPGLGVSEAPACEVLDTCSLGSTSRRQ